MLNVFFRISAIYSFSINIFHEPKSLLNLLLNKIAIDFCLFSIFHELLGLNNGLTLQHCIYIWMTRAVLEFGLSLTQPYNTNL